jgi:hypothetical protein
MSNLENMTQEELVGLARERGIEVTPKMTKDQLVNALREDRTASTAQLRAEDEQWVKLQEELAGLRREVEEARLERERAEEEFRREQQEAWLEKEQVLARLQAREAAVRRRARERARELRERARTISERAWGDEDVAGDRVPGFDEGIRSSQMYCSANDVTRLLRSLATAFADVAGSVADAMLPTGSTQESMDRTRAGGSRTRMSSSGSRGGRSGQEMMMGLSSPAYNRLRDVVDRSLNIPSRAVDRFYSEYYKK